MVKVLIKRVVPKTKSSKMVDLFRQMHILAVNQEGYVSAETFNNVNDPEEFLVISTWQNAVSWFTWFENPERQELQKKIDAFLDKPTSYAVYNYGFSK